MNKKIITILISASLLMAGLGPIAARASEVTGTLSSGGTSTPGSSGSTSGTLGGTVTGGSSGGSASSGGGGGSSPLSSSSSGGGGGSSSLGSQTSGGSSDFGIGGTLENPDTVQNGSAIASAPAGGDQNQAALTAPEVSPDQSAGTGLTAAVGNAKGVGTWMWIVFGILALLLAGLLLYRKSKERNGRLAI